MLQILAALQRRQEMIWTELYHWLLKKAGTTLKAPLTAN